MIPPKPLCYFLLILTACCAPFAKGASDSDETAIEERKKEALDKKRDEDALIQAQFNFSLDDIGNKLVVIKHEMGSGNGFIASMNGKTYLVTNQHILLGAKKISFKTATGEILRPRGVELSTSRDIARLLLIDGTEGFGITADMPMDSPVGIFGNSTADETAIELYGTVTGIGAEIVEVSADFVEENSGSPVLNIDQEVLGIASYVRESNTHAMKEGTKFENRIRRFCYRMTNTLWKPVNWKIYNKKYGEFYRKNNMFTEGVIEVFSNWSKDTLMEKIRVTKNPERSLISWVESHNKIIAKHSFSNQKKRFSSEYSNSLKQLSESCSGRARQIRLFSEQRELTDFLRDELDMQARTLDYFAKTLDHIGNMAQDYR